MTPNITLFPCGIFVFGIVGHSRCTERYGLLSAVFFEYGIILFFGAMRLANRFQTKRHYIIVGYFLAKVH